ncbi:MAG: hypothetical protein K2X77_17840 [Candidatus Obscuribacterales bacterium]|nr:hypothetical protein [Candidatus Obscuribacterales bacterium]
MAEFENTDNSRQTDNVRENTESRGAESAMQNEVNESRQNASNISDSRNNGSADSYLPDMEISGLDSENTDAPKDETEKPQSDEDKKDGPRNDGTDPTYDQKAKEKPNEPEDGRKDGPNFQLDMGNYEKREQKNKPQEATESKQSTLPKRR